MMNLLQVMATRQAHTKASEVYSPSAVSRLWLRSSTSQLASNAVFRDLWGKGYWITPGHKFGADFLLYKGDPVSFHALMVVHIVATTSSEPTGLGVVGLVRLATAVRKTVVLASSADPAWTTIRYRVIKFAGVTQRGWVAGDEADAKVDRSEPVSEPPTLTEPSTNTDCSTQGTRTGPGRQQKKSRRKRPREPAVV